MYVREMGIHLFSLFKEPEYRCHGSDIKGVSTHSQ
jgi:hypothetical protein